MEILDVSQNEKSLWHGRYGGQAGDKDGIIIDGEKWIVKYPKSTKGMLGNNSAYTSAPLSEYIGSHIYSILGQDVHETMLVYRNNQIAVACKDFQEHFGDLVEIRTIKNSANREISESIGEDFPLSATGDSVNLEELLLHFKVNPLMKRNDLIERFWDCVVIDIFIDNNDRNNGNWGLLFNEQNKNYDLAPVYDNGNSFFNKMSEDKISELLNISDNENLFLGSRTVYEYKNHILSAKKMLQFDNDNLKQAIVRTVPKIKENIPYIFDFIDNIPEQYEGKLVCSSNRKEFYKDSLQTRLDKLLEPAYEKALQELNKNIEEEIDR